MNQRSKTPLIDSHHRLAPCPCRERPIAPHSVPPCLPLVVQPGVSWNGGQYQYSWLQVTTLQVSQERPARAGVRWQELAPPVGELTAQADGYDCHTMASRAITPSLAVRSPSPLLTSSMSPRCYNLATQKGPALHVCCTHQGLLFRLSS